MKVCSVQSATHDMFTSKSINFSPSEPFLPYFCKFNYMVKLYMNIHVLCTENKCLFFVCNSGLRAVRNYTVGGFSSGEILAFCYTGKIK